jgi:hypothetical protein
MKGFIYVLLAALLLYGNEAFAQKFILFDDEITIEEEHNGFYYFKPPGEGSRSWLKPFDFYNGKFFVRYEVTEFPSQAPLILNICIWSDVVGKWKDWKETCSPGVDVDVNHPYCIESSPSAWWKLDDAVDFSRVKDFENLGMVVFCERWKNLTSLVPDSLSCWERREEYLPLKLRLTLIAVAKGYEFSGWGKYGFPAEEGQNPPSGLKASISSEGIEIQWEDNSDTEVGFIVERSLFPDKNFVEITNAAANVTTYEDPDVKKNTTYYYRVKRNGFGVDDYTDELKIKTP